MAEYIEREAFYRFLTEQKGKETGAYSKGRNAGLNVARSALHNREITPAADVAPVRHGRWELVTTKYFAAQYARVGYCQNCNEERIVDNYCPNCGARMGGE